MILSLKVNSNGPFLSFIFKNGLKSVFFFLGRIIQHYTVAQHALFSATKNLVAGIALFSAIVIFPPARWKNRFSVIIGLCQNWMRAYFQVKNCLSKDKTNQCFDYLEFRHNYKYRWAERLHVCIRCGHCQKKSLKKRYVFMVQLWKSLDLKACICRWSDVTISVSLGLECKILWIWVNAGAYWSRSSIPIGVLKRIKLGE